MSDDNNGFEIDYRQHAGCCSIYQAMDNGLPEDGICTCGGAHKFALANDGDDRHFYSPERRAAMSDDNGGWELASPNIIMSQDAEALIQCPCGAPPYFVSDTEEDVKCDCGRKYRTTFKLEMKEA
jgi:hypothetical protein